MHTGRWEGSTNWSKLRRGGFAEEGEILAAARRAREDEKLRGLLSRASSGKGAKERKGKTIKVPTRANPPETGRGKGGGSGKDDKKESWQKKVTAKEWDVDSSEGTERKKRPRREEENSTPKKGGWIEAKRARG